MLMGMAWGAASSWGRRERLRDVDAALGDLLLWIDERQRDDRRGMARLAREALHLDALPRRRVLELDHGEPDVLFQCGGVDKRGGAAHEGPRSVHSPRSLKFVRSRLAVHLEPHQLACDSCPADAI